MSTWWFTWNREGGKCSQWRGMATSCVSLPSFTEHITTWHPVGSYWAVWSEWLSLWPVRNGLMCKHKRESTSTDKYFCNVQHTLAIRRVTFWKTSANDKTDTLAKSSWCNGNLHDMSILRCDVELDRLLCNFSITRKRWSNVWIQKLVMSVKEPLRMVRKGPEYIWK
jgi:hypothetical protein